MGRAPVFSVTGARKMVSNKQYSQLQLLCELHFFLLLLLPISDARVFTQQRSIPAILVFGDSTVDPGNNNFIETSFKSNFPPYGRDFFNQMPTGRFSNGRLVTDYIASYVGVKEFLPAYLDPNLDINELLTGVSFASAGSGFDPLTSTISNVVPMSKQLDYFKEYKKRLESAIGNNRTEAHIKRAVFVISAGTNDFVIDYFLLPLRRRIYPLSAYQRFLIQRLSEFLQGLWAEGARKFAIVGLPPMGCLPAVITLNSNNALLRRGCVESYSSAASQFNGVLQKELVSMEAKLAEHGGKFYYVDIYGPLMDMIDGFDKYGFEETGRGCCGSGYVEASFLCNPKSIVCGDASKYVFWDSIHPTQTAYYNIFAAVRPIVDAMINL